MHTQTSMSPKDVSMSVLVGAFGHSYLSLLFLGGIKVC